MRLLRVSVAAGLAFTWATTGLAAGAPGEENTACESKSSGGDYVEFTCPLATTGPAKVWRFKADFSGGHDDTSASMSLTLDGVPLECDAGSKTRLFGEDGDVSLICRFRARAATGAQSSLGVALLWSHAQYMRTELVAE